MSSSIPNFKQLWLEPRTLWGGAMLYPRATIWTNLVKDHQAMLHIKFQTSEQSGSDDEDFEKNIYF